MNKHMLILPLMLVSATALLMFSLSLPDDNQPAVIASSTPEPVSTTIKTTTTTQTKTVTKPPGKPMPTPKPSPTASQLPSFGIAATNPEAVLREAQIHAGRIDPFKSVFAPDLPEFDPAISPEQMALPSLPPDLLEESTPPQPVPLDPIIIRPTSRPSQIETPVEIPPEPALEEGLILKGIIDGGVDPVALVEVNGKTEMVRVGERLPGEILVTSIHFEGKYIKISRGRQTATLQLAIPTAPNY